MVRRGGYTYQCWKLLSLGASFATGRLGVCQVPIAPHSKGPTVERARLVICSPGISVVSSEKAKLKRSRLVCNTRSLKESGWGVCVCSLFVNTKHTGRASGLAACPIRWRKEGMPSV